MSDQGGDTDFTGEGARRRQLLLGGGAALATGAAAIMAGASPVAAQDTIPVYLPIGPVRVYDSRRGGGRLNSGQAEELTGDPAQAFAECYNVTVTETRGTGWLAVYEAGTTYSGTSSINWYGNNQTTANNAYTAVRQSDSGITVRCGGGGSTQYVIDLVAALLFLAPNDATRAIMSGQAVAANGAGRPSDATQLRSATRLR